MNNFPESARRRMQALEPGLAKSGPDRDTRGEHPDADLLTAFSERALGGAERETVLLHLATCPTCRDVVALAMPEYQETAEVAAPVAGSWFRWPVLRWSAVAAAMIVVGAAVSVLVVRDKSVEVAVPAQQSSTSAPQAQAKEKEEVASNNERAALPAKKPVAGTEKKQRAEIEVANNQPTLQAAPPAENKRDLAEAAAAPMAKAEESDKFTSKTKALDDEASKKVMARKDTDTVVVTTQNAVVGGATGAVFADKVAAAPTQTASAPHSPPPTEASSAMRAQGGVSGGFISRNPMSLSKSRTDDNTRWHVSSSGAVERSSDGARWEPVEIDPRVTFRAISSENGDLWAGGTGGALFHSPDGGQTWSRVKVGSDGMWVSDAITSLSFSNPRTGYIMTESRATWTTQDGGRTWQRKQ